MTKRVKTYNRYSICFKEKVIEEVSSGASINDVRRRYGIQGSNTVQKWIKQYGREELLSKVVRIEMKGEQDRLKTLEKEVKMLKIKLADKVLTIESLATVIEKASKHYGLDIQEKFGGNA